MENESDKIPYGYCHCGCGKKTKISPKTCTSKGWVKGKPRNYLHGHHLKSGSAHPRWNGGKFVVKSRNKQYVLVSAYGHPRNKKGRVFEHILKAEKALGKYLPVNAVIHHIDEDGLNNSNDNLVVCEDNAYHQLIHAKMRRL